METALQTQISELKKMPAVLETFSKGLRKIYVDNEGDSKFCAIRDGVRNDAFVIAKCILPGTRSIILYMKEYVETYLDLDLETWSGNLDEIKQLLSTYKGKCSLLVKLYDKIIVSLKRSQDEAERAQKAADATAWFWQDKSQHIRTLLGTIGQLIQCVTAYENFFRKAEENLARMGTSSKQGKLYYDMMKPKAVEIKNLCHTLTIKTIGEVSSKLFITCNVYIRVDSGTRKLDEAKEILNGMVPVLPLTPHIVTTNHHALDMQVKFQTLLYLYLCRRYT